MAQRYDTYKDSGVQWLGEIPSHWKSILNGFIFREDVRTPKEGDISLSLSQKDGLIPTDEMKESSLKTSSYDNWKRVLPNDLVLNRFKAHLGVMFASKYEGMVSFHYGVYKSILPTNPKYYEYLFHTPTYRFIYAEASKGMTVGLQNLSNAGFYNIKSTYPPLSEQHSIVTYLDDKCAKIDEWIEKKEKEVELLGEMKQRVIADAVTRGLNPNVKMKETGIAWLPEVPEHWEVVKAKNLFKKEQRPVIEGDDIVTCFRDGEVTLRKNRRTTGFTEATDYSHYQHICKGDLVIHQMDAFAGACGVSDSDGMGTPVLSVCTPKTDKTLNYYYAHIVRLMGKNGYILSLYRGIRERSSDFRFDTFGKQWLPVPPHSEQQEIVSYINDKTSKIDTLVAKVTKEIEHLKEYKQRLISDVVTGQIKVC